MASEEAPRVPPLPLIEVVVGTYEQFLIGYQLRRVEVSGRDGNVSQGRGRGLVSLIAPEMRRR